MSFSVCLIVRVSQFFSVYECVRQCAYMCVCQSVSVGVCVCHCEGIKNDNIHFSATSSHQASHTLGINIGSGVKTVLGMNIG